MGTDQDTPEVALSQESYCIARQIICDEDLNLSAYELLYRNNASTSEAFVSSPHEATARVLTIAFMDIGIDRLAGQHPVFINMTDELLLKGDMLPEPADRVVLEVLEDIKPTPEMLSALKALRSRGYKIALDDFALTQETRAFLPYADIIKLDVMACSVEVLKKRVEILSRLPDITLLAEKVETWEEFEACKAMGFRLFQGYFLSKPETMKDQPKSDSKLVLTQLLAMLHQAEPDVAEIEQQISRDPQLYYRILRYINSAQFALSKNIESLRQAIVLLGFDQLRSLVSMMVLAGSSRRGPTLMPIALLRARMCECIAVKSGYETKETYFTVGLLSMLDAFFNRDLMSILEDLPLHDSIEQALLHFEGAPGRVLKVVEAYERADWGYVQNAGFDKEMLAACYVDSMAWADEVVGLATT
ncbi:EAL and HDOD domain-containing protein [Oceanospirillum sediminis]|uniref:HDOD domain-containing protein n=1 Tax=Oceanospirillum sediminis TaxID=2760088 RepID=A0A839ITC9_9GAMM|nr:HDOD domain-containing protein [Oceanospirillum sediminis]MBB1487892.1 HDOD domain-containing protein [Oceanospirillum sediminis]